MWVLFFVGCLHCSVIKSLAANQSLDEYVDELHLRDLIEKFLEKQTEETRNSLRKFLEHEEVVV